MKKEIRCFKTTLRPFTCLWFPYWLWLNVCVRLLPYSFLEYIMSYPQLPTQWARQDDHRSSYIIIPQHPAMNGQCWWRHHRAGLRHFECWEKCRSWRRIELRRRVGCRKKARESLRFKSELKDYREKLLSEVRLHPFPDELLAIK